MPTGTGKTVSLLSLILAYIAENPEKIKKVFIFILYRFYNGNFN